MVNNQNLTWVDTAVSEIRNKMEWVSEKSKEKIPYTTINGTHNDCIKDNYGINWWTNGFWGGMMWLMYHETGEDRYAEIAYFSEVQLDTCFTKYEGLHHDVGFMWLPTGIANYRLTGNHESYIRGMHAASLLAGRFNPAGQFIRAWNNDFGHGADNRGWAIIDCMMNLPILYWASKESEDPRFRQIAMLHADTAMKAFIRGDGSVRHIVDFDPEHGGMVCDYAGQGYELGSSWTRGQAWGLYGFLLNYLHTKKEDYLNTAKQIAHYFIANIPESGIIPVDFRQPETPAYEDSTAAAIAACGLLEISKQVGEHEKKLYEDAAIKLLKTLYEKRCDFTMDCDCILKNCTAAYHDKEHHFNIIYGDYFFMEGIFKLKGNDILLW